jgi:hypothetical protein
MNIEIKYIKNASYETLLNFARIFNIDKIIKSM